MGKKEIKHKKKRSHKKKHGKEKKKHKERRYRYQKKSSSNSDNETSSSLSSSETHEKKKFVKESANAIQDEIDWNDLFSEKHIFAKKKNEPKRERYMLDMPGQSARELNPYWKDGGNGLPSPNKKVAVTCDKNYDVKSLKKILDKAKNTADITGIPLDQVIGEEWGPLEKLEQIIQVSEAEKGKDQATINIQSCSEMSEMKSEVITEITGRKLNFIKPEECMPSYFVKTCRMNWKKKNEVKYESAEQIDVQSKSLEDREAVKAAYGSEKKAVLTPDELNALAAKKIKAEIMGNKALAERLEREMEDAKKDRTNFVTAGGSKQEHIKEEVVVVSKSVLEKLHKSSEDGHKDPKHSRKRQKGETCRENKRLRYFMDDDKHSLKSMFEREKLGGTVQSNELLLKLAKKGKFRTNFNDNDIDDEFVDRVRYVDCDDKERDRAIDEARSKHKTLSHCRWCLEGNNVRRHLIISLGSKCYLCLPSDKSLTDGHCLIVPVHHDTCGTQLDEDVWNEMHSYRNRLCKMFEDAGQDVVFFENARSFNRFPHMILHCVPMNKEIGDLAPIYFKKAIMESETEWSNNRKLIDLRNKDLRRSVPKGLPYFTVDFGRDAGFAHVIEDEKLFPSNFAEEIIGGMLDLDATSWRKQRRESLECQKMKVQEFLTRWKKYEDVEYKDRCTPGADRDES